MKYILKRIIGTERYEVCCSSPSRICGKLMSEFPGNVYGVRVNTRDSFTFHSMKPYSKKVLDFLENYGCSVKRLSGSGLPTYISHFIARPGMLVGLVFALGTMFFCNGIVWDIEISGNDRIGESEIEQILATAGLAVGKRYDSDKLPSVCNRFIILDDRFTRISVNMSGNKAFAQVTERTKKNLTDSSVSDSGIVSQYDCIIERPEVVHGTSLVKKGDVAEKGTMLISPVEKGNDGNEYISGAKGKIYAVTTEKFAVCVPLSSLKINENTSVYTDSTLDFLGVSLPLEPFGKEPERYHCITTTEKLCIGEDITMPFRLTVTRKTGFETVDIVLAKEEAEKKAYEIMYSKIFRDLAECEILSTEFETVTDDTCLTLYCSAECLRDVVQK